MGKPAAVPLALVLVLLQLLPLALVLVLLQLLPLALVLVLLQQLLLAVALKALAAHMPLLIMLTGEGKKHALCTGFRGFWKKNLGYRNLLGNCRRF